MKPLAPILLISLIALWLPSSSHAQDLSNLHLAAHWPLLNGPEDVLGQLDSVHLVNAPLHPSSGAYSNGIYYAEEPETGSYIRTPPLESLFDSVFAVRLQFTIETLDGTIRPIIVLGEDYRYLGLVVMFDNTFAMLLNNLSYIPIPGVTANAGILYDLTLIHFSTEDRTEIYLSGIQLLDAPSPLVREENDNEITNTHFGSGSAFLGYWRDLQVYGSDEVTALREGFVRSIPMQVFPNPASSWIHITDPDANQWRITDLTGQVQLSGHIDHPTHHIDISTLPAGLFHISTQTAHRPSRHAAFVRKE